MSVGLGDDFSSILSASANVLGSLVTAGGNVGVALIGADAAKSIAHDQEKTQLQAFVDQAGFELERARTQRDTETALATIAANAPPTSALGLSSVFSGSGGFLVGAACALILAWLIGGSRA